MKKQTPKYRIQKRKVCNQKWDQMQPHGVARLCSQCDHIVHDFRDMSLEEIAKVHATSKGKICGTYDKRTLAQAQEIPYMNPTCSPWKHLTTATVALLMSSQIAGQEKPINPTINTEIVSANNQDDKTNSKESKPVIKSKDFIIQGKIVDVNNEPLEAATIVFFGDSTNTNEFKGLCGVLSDIDGNFKIEDKSLSGNYHQYTIEVRHWGYEKKLFHYSREQFTRLEQKCLYVKMDSTTFESGDIIIKPTFQRRIWWKTKGFFHRIFTRY